jgi:hypothetical protein
MGRGGIMSDEGYICVCCGKESWVKDLESNYYCPYRDEHGEHKWQLAWSTETK